jgi:membrane-bound lytic murein transglycosylase D
MRNSTRFSPAGILVLVAALAASACAVHRDAPTTTPAPVEPAPPPPPPPAPPGPTAEEIAQRDELYSRLEAASASYRQGLELIVAGDEIAGEELTGEASQILVAAAAECDGLESCDVGRFVQAFDALLTEEGIALKTQTSRLGELETTIAEDVEREPGTEEFVAVLPEVGHTVSLLRGTDLREIINLNGPVKAALGDWLTWMRADLIEAYRNYQFLRDDIAPIYEQAGLPEALLFAMIATESGGKVHAYSRAGAAGLLQFMSRTGRVYGLRVVGGFDQRLDPAAATAANVAYLNERFAELNDSLDKALAAYNGGEGRMKTLHRQHKGASLWDSRIYYALPKETREYVPRVLAAAWLFLHPEEYNLEWPAVETAKTTLVLEDEISLDELTICLGQEHNPDGWFRTLRNLNPAFGPGERIDAGEEIVIPEVLIPAYRERCVQGDVIELARALHDAGHPDGSELVPYIVQRGDTLSKIASRHSCVTLPELAALNNIPPPRYVIRVGQHLKVPACG